MGSASAAENRLTPKGSQPCLTRPCAANAPNAGADPARLEASGRPAHAGRLS
jgi:hypothetical protein